MPRRELRESVRLALQAARQEMTTYGSKSFQTRLSQAFSNGAWKLHRHLIASGDEAFLDLLFGKDHARRPSDLSQFYGELQEFSPLRKLCAEKTIPSGARYDYDRMISAETSWHPVLYAIVRIHKPTFVIETGCATGFTSALILYGLHQNQKGHLTSIDLPPKTGQFGMRWSLPNGMMPGFLVPRTLKHEGRWSLITADIREYLPKLLQSRGDQYVDLFFHDSDHSYDHQMWEYLTVWSKLSEGGLILSDDIGWSPAFRDFGRRVRRRVAIHHSNANFGAIRK